MKKRWWLIAVLLVVLVSVVAWGCKTTVDQTKIGVSFGVGSAARWPLEKGFMEARAMELGVELEARLNKGDGPKTQLEDCKELIDSGIDVLILTIRTGSSADEILDYAEKKNVPVVCYARSVSDKRVSLLVGYDSDRIGQKQGHFLTDLIYRGDYLILRGDAGDNNAQQLYEGAMRMIEDEGNDIRVIANTEVEGWDPERAKQIVKEAVAANGNRVDAILAPNDALAGASLEALEELGVTDHVVITGMDAELAAVQRILAGTQDMTVYMDLKILANTAVEEACHIAKKETVNVNTEYDVGDGNRIPANMITGQVVTKENIDQILIDGGYYTREEVYGTAE